MFKLSGKFLAVCSEGLHEPLSRRMKWPAILHPGLAAGKLVFQGKHCMKIEIPYRLTHTIFRPSSDIRRTLFLSCALVCTFKLAVSIITVSSGLLQEKYAIINC